jgi:hypothetical protein
MPSYLPEIIAVQFQNGVLTEGRSAGHLVSPAPRRAARGRAGEIFLSALDLRSRNALPATELDRIAALMASVYFDTPGSVTAALRAAFTAANAEVLPFSQTTASSIPGTGMVQLNALCAVVREGDLFIVYAGDTLALIARESGVEQYPAPGDTPARALGLALNVDFRYGHSTLSGPATLVLAANPAPAWTASVPGGLGRLSFRALGERMAQQAAACVEPSGAFLVRFAEAPAAEKKPGGVFGRARSHLAEVPRKGSAPQPMTRPAENREPSPIQPAAETPAHPTPPIAKPGSDHPTDGTGRLPDRPPAGNVRIPPPPAARPPRPFSSPPPTPRPGYPAAPSPRPDLRKIGVAFTGGIRNGLGAIPSFLRRFTGRLLPQGVLQQNDRLSLSQPVMLGTAIAIPLIVVAVVAVIYFRKGREMEFSRLMEEAQVSASAARAQSDPLAAREAWQETFDLLKTASVYGSSDEFSMLQNQAARMLDSIDRIEPLDFQPVVAGGLEAGTRITAMRVEDRVIYALDSGHNRILQLLPGQGGYQVGSGFICAGSAQTDGAIGSLLDLAWIPDMEVGGQQPSSSRGGVIAAIDSAGGILYCPPEGYAVAGSLATPRTGWSSPSALEYYNGRLYVLDTGTNGFWRYSVSDADGFNREPSDYFGSERPTLSDAVDFTVASGEVFFLHADGHVTRCMYDALLDQGDGGAEGGTQCEQMVFNDTRPGQTPGPRIPDAMLTRLFYNDYPEPTLFFLDPLGRGAFRFSLMLNFLARYRVTVAPEDLEATALAVGTDKVLYIAVGNQIYYARPSTP